jgi:hypothetical protein
LIDRNYRKTHEFQGAKASFLRLLEASLLQGEKLSIIVPLTKAENLSFTTAKYYLIQSFNFTVFHVDLQAIHEGKTI